MIRYLEKFTSIDGLTSYTFPLGAYQWETQQQIRNALSQSVGASYSYNHLGVNPAALNDAQETVRFADKQNTAALLEADIDNLRSKLYSIGKGKLYTLSDDGTRRWAYAQLAGMPKIVVTQVNRRYVPVIVEFIRSSDWHGTTQETGTQALSANITTFTITNPGNAATEEVVIRIRANSATGYHSGIVILNQTNGHSITWNRAAASVDDELKLDGGANSTKYSTNNGASYTDDYVNVTLGAQQNALFLLDAGANQIQVTDGGGGTPDASFEWAYDPLYR
jgi:hypothetical protein